MWVNHLVSPPYPLKSSNFCFTDELNFFCQYSTQSFICGMFQMSAYFIVEERFDYEKNSPVS